MCPTKYHSSQATGKLNQFCNTTTYYIFGSQRERGTEQLQLVKIGRGGGGGGGGGGSGEREIFFKYFSPTGNWRR